jgi:hypothetical protein
LHFLSEEHLLAIDEASLPGADAASEPHKELFAVWCWTVSLYAADAKIDLRVGSVPWRKVRGKQ